MDSPRLTDLPAKDLKKLAKIVVAESLKDDLRHAAWSGSTAGPSVGGSWSGRAARIGAYCKSLPGGAGPTAQVEVTPTTVRLTMAGASTLWIWLKRRHAELRNPVRGTRIRPLEGAEHGGNRRAGSRGGPRAAGGPHDDVEDRAVGWGLPGAVDPRGPLHDHDEGRGPEGAISEDERPGIEPVELSLRVPSAYLTSGNIADRFFYLAGKLGATGESRAVYSVHDLRDAFAVRLYKQRTRIGQSGCDGRVSVLSGRSGLILESYL